MPTIGLTGNFGMGKTTVLELFRKLGAHTFNIDKFVHDILKRPEIIKKIAGVLGKDVLIKNAPTASINKALAADIIFNDPEKRKAVEKIIHPLVLKIIKTTGSGLLKKEPSALLIFEVPLLFEAGYGKHFDKIIVVYCSRDKAAARLLEKGITKEQAYKRVRAQMPITNKKKLADFIIDNNDGLSKTETQVRRIFRTLQKK